MIKMIQISSFVQRNAILSVPFTSPPESPQQTTFQLRNPSENSFERKEVTWLGNHVHLGEHFPTHQELGLVKDILEVIGNRGLEIWCLSPCVLGSISGAQEPTGSCGTHVRFSKAIKILKFLKLSKNSRLVSPVLGFLDSSQSSAHPWFST